ncbi:MAG: glycoside hydrolase family 30 beta sandwich domain-containing protein [Gemmatimonadales bacterium]
MMTAFYRLCCHRRAVAAVIFGCVSAAACSGQDAVVSATPPPPPPPNACLMPSGALPAADVTVAINAQLRHQTIDGFGTSIRLFDDPHLTETFDQGTQRGAVLVPAADQARILEALYSELHLTRLRYATDPGVEVANDNSDPAVTDLSRFDFRWKRLDGHVEFVKAARPFGLNAWYGSPIGIESWMSHSDPAEYVEWAMAIIRRWRDQGATLSYWSIINEPGYAANLSPAFIRDAVKLIGAKLAVEKIPTRLVIPDDADPGVALPRAQAVLGDPVARQYVAAIATHLYTGFGTPSQPNTASLTELSALARQYNVPLWMTEWYNPDWFTWVRTMHAMLSDYNVSAVDYMWGFLGQWENVGSQLITVNSSGPLYTGFVKNKQFWAMGQYSRFVLPGSVRVSATSSDPAVLVTAYLVGNRVVVVALNTGGVEKSVQVALGAGAPCVLQLTAERTGVLETARVLDPVTLTGPGFTTALPAGSITTFQLIP